MVHFPARERLQGVILARWGMGWRVGIGAIATGRIEREASVYMIERDAVAAAIRLADAHDIIAVRG